MNNPWTPVIRDVVNFKDVLSEELARSLIEKDTAKCDDLVSDFDTVCLNNDENEEFVCESERNDALIAHLLQSQYDDEYDTGLKRYELKINRGSKVSLSLDKYLRKNLVDRECGNETANENNAECYDRLETAEKIMSQIPKKRGYVKIDGQLITKHDDLLTSRINTSKLMDFSPEFKTGDGDKNDVKLSNKVYNSLKEYSLGEQHRRARCKDKKEDGSFQEKCFNDETNLELKKLLKNKLNSIESIVGIGKEAVVLHAILNSHYSNYSDSGSDCVLKVFKTSLADFKPRAKYIKDDNRFKDRFSKQNRKYIIQWAEKERLNLDRLRKIGIRCPKVILQLKNVLVETFVGENGNAAPRLKDVQFKSFDELQIAYDETIDAMKRIYKEAQLILGDLSEFNILWFKGNCWFIDVSLAVEPTHPNAFHFLMRDCINVINYFSRKGLEQILTVEELFYEISGEQYSENKPNVDLKVRFNNVNYNRDLFDQDWENSKRSSFDSGN